MSRQEMSRREFGVACFRWGVALVGVEALAACAPASTNSVRREVTPTPTPDLFPPDYTYNGPKNALDNSVAPLIESVKSQYDIDIISPTIWNDGAGNTIPNVAWTAHELSTLVNVLQRLPPLYL